jgi:hypothetical protein
MIEQYDFKVIISGREIETYHYKDKKMFRGYKKKKQVEVEEIEAKTTEQEKEEISPTEWAEIVEEWGCEEEKEKLHREQTEAKKEQNQKTHSSICRTRTNIRRLVNANQHLNQFLTLTFADSMPDLKKANRLFDRAIKRILWAYPEFQYIAVNEFQSDFYFRTGKRKPEGGSVHYHLLCNLGPKDTNKEKLFMWERKFAVKYWRNGFVKIKLVEKVTNMGAYFCKYLSKDMFDKRMFRKKKFFCSRTLQRPIELTGEKATSFFNRFVKSTKPIFEKTFKSEYTGEVDYSAYTLEKIP